MLAPQKQTGLAAAKMGGRVQPEPWRGRVGADAWSANAPGSEQDKANPDAVNGSIGGSNNDSATYTHKRRRGLSWLAFV
jgi:hypothetical protein